MEEEDLSNDRGSQEPVWMWTPSLLCPVYVSYPLSPGWMQGARPSGRNFVSRVSRNSRTEAEGGFAGHVLNYLTWKVNAKATVNMTRVHFSMISEKPDKPEANAAEMRDEVLGCCVVGALVLDVPLTHEPAVGALVLDVPLTHEPAVGALVLDVPLSPRASGGGPGAGRCPDP
uniref:Uncharacterized protein n=1 Tax=Molossus molossus TaxID=27622 RepID=A0A7J8BN01_MOLMO|nr:hypothetical protein HJG59_010102 [Molossus molossus]